LAPNTLINNNIIIIIITIIIIQFFAYVHAELNSQWPIIKSARIQTTAAIREHGAKQTKDNKKRSVKVVYF
jgi:hypothetical protein